MSKLMEEMTENIFLQLLKFCSYAFSYCSIDFFGINYDETALTGSTSSEWSPRNEKFIIPYHFTPAIQFLYVKFDNSTNVTSNFKATHIYE